MHLGLIGGIGPAATIVYYDRLSRRVREAGGTLELTIVNANLDELIANVNADRRPEQARAYAALIDRLRAAGAECAAITSLGGHFCFPETEAISSRFSNGSHSASATLARPDAEEIPFASSCAATPEKEDAPSVPATPCSA